MEYNDGHVYTEYTLGYKTGNFQLLTNLTVSLLLSSVCFFGCFNVSNFVDPAAKI